MAAPRKVGDKWRAQVQKDGVRVSKVFDRKTDATKWLLEQDSKTTLKSRSLEAAVDLYTRTVTPTKRDGSREGARLEEFVAHMPKGISLGDITQAHIAAWRDGRLKTVSPSTVVREANIIRNMFRTAMLEWRWIDKHPFTGVKLPSENAPRTAQWRWQDIRRILRAGQRTGGKTLEVTQAFHIALRTALRLQEALQVGGFDPARRVVVLGPTKTEPRGEVVPLTGAAYRLLCKMPRTFAVEANEASVLFSKLCKQQLIDGLQFKDSRATALTLLARKVDVLTLAKISRHKNLELLRSTYYRETAEEISARLRGL